jgi:GNAT superfamily N-acetyltransferase
MYRISPARPSDLHLLPAIELAAARLLAGHAPESVLTETTSQEDFQDAQHRGYLWVALADDVAVGFAQVKVIEPGAAHLDEIDVHPDHGRRGLGTQLVMAVCEWAANAGKAAVTLTTFRDVAWNMPFYARLGFEVIPVNALTPALLSVVEDETRRGLDPTRRVTMRRASVL